MELGEPINTVGMAGPFLGAAATVLVAILGYLGKRAISREARDKDRLAQQQSYDQAQASSVTERLKTLMEGYENRIKDLTFEVTGLRDEVKKVRQALDMRTQLCAGCPNYAQWIKDHPNAQPAA